MERLRELRTNSNLTQKELAEKISTTQTTIGKYERGELEPNFEILKKLSSIFGVTTDYLLGLEDDTKFYVPELNFTSADKSQGVGNHGAKLSDEEWEVVELFSELKRAKGEKAVRAVIAMIQTLIDSSDAVK